MTVDEFRRLPIKPGGVKVQPPNGRTLVNVPTNLYVQANRQELQTELLGTPVRVRATPREYVWRYGDDTSVATTATGGPYPDLSTAHTYTKAGAMSVVLTTRYGGEYSVDGRPWLPIAGTAEVASPPVALTVIALENRLVADPLY